MCILYDKIVITEIFSRYYKSPNYASFIQALKHTVHSTIILVRNEMEENIKQEIVHC